MKKIRSPLFYVGDKYKLMPQLKELFPNEIDVYVEPFLGGGSSFLYTNAKRYILNDANIWIVKIHKELLKWVDRKEELFNKLFDMVDYYGFSCSCRGKTVPNQLKKEYPKTYYAKYNKESYSKLKNDFNENKEDILKLYLLLIYGFNHMVRFNSTGDFNLPVGDVDFNNNVYDALNNYLDLCGNRKIEIYNLDYKEFFKKIKLRKKGTFIYFDPPYLISSSEYNKYWTETNEMELYKKLDELNKKGIKFGITNLIHHKGKTNSYIIEWSKKYQTYNIISNYISFNDNSIKNESKEVFVTNYGTTERM